MWTGMLILEIYCLEAKLIPMEISPIFLEKIFEWTLDINL